MDVALYLLGRALILALCVALAVTLIDIGSNMRKGEFPPVLLGMMALAVSALTVGIAFVVERVLIEGGVDAVLMTWEELGFDLGGRGLP